MEEINCLERMPLPVRTDEERFMEIKSSIRLTKKILNNLFKEEREVIERLKKQTPK